MAAAQAEGFPAVRGKRAQQHHVGRIFTLHDASASTITPQNAGTGAAIGSVTIVSVVWLRWT